MMIALALAVAVTFTQTAPAPHSIASPAWATIDVRPELALFYADHLAVALREDGFKVITQSEISAIIGAERQAQLLGCSDAAKSCMAELANALGAELTLVGSIAKLDDVFRVHLKLIRPDTGAVVAEQELDAKGENAVLDALTKAGHKLVEPIKPPPPPSSLRARSWMPFTGGGVMLALSAVAFIFAASTYDTVQAELINPASAIGPNGKAYKDAQDGKNSQVIGWVCFGVGAAAIAAGIVMVVLGAPADHASPSVMVSPGLNGFALSGSF
jgi:hypothetical protein